MDAEMVFRKEEYEQMMYHFGYTVKAYEVDNSCFNSDEFQDCCKLAHQTFIYCGVGAHYQKSIGKAYIKKVVNASYALLLCAKRR